MTVIKRKSDSKEFIVVEEKEGFGEIFVLVRSIDGEEMLLTIQDALRAFELVNMED